MAGLSRIKVQAGQRAYLSGLAAEEIIARQYERQGLTIAHRRWRGQTGEIDLIARDGDRIIFVEVKKAQSIRQSYLRLRRDQIARICAAAEEFIGDEPMGSLTEIRVDLALVGADGQFEILENALA